MTLLGAEPVAKKETPTAPYDPLAPHYDAFINAPEYESWLASLLALTAEHGLRGGLALDVGCGTGRSIAALIAAGFEAAGVDASPAMLREARKRLGDDVELGVSTLPESLPAGPALQLITAFNDVLNYVAPSALNRAVAALAARLAPGGMLLFDANTPLTYATFFGAPHMRDAVDSVFFSEPLPSVGPAHHAALHAFTITPEGTWERSVSHHVQHHHPHELVVAALRAAGLELLEARGVHDGGALDPTCDEAVHIKRIYLAQLP